MQDSDLLIEEVLKIFKRTNHRADLILYPRRARSIDIVANIENKSIMLKIVEDLETLSKIEISDIRKIKRAFQATPLIVASEDSGRELEDDAVYIKYNTVVVTSKTLENYLVRGEKPLVTYIRGSYVLKINPEKLRKKREELRYSRGVIAEALGVSKKALYMYERGEVYIAVDKGIRLASILGEDVFEELDFIREENSRKPPTSDDTPRDGVEKALYELARETGSFFTSFSRLPIDVVIKGASTVSIVREDILNEHGEKVRSAEKITSITDTEMMVLKSTRDLLNLRRKLLRDIGIDYKQRSRDDRH